MTPVTSDDRSLQLAVEKIEKDFGKGAIMRLGDQPRHSSENTIPTGSLALDIASFPWLCVVNDRRSVYEGLGMGIDEALANEDRLGRAVIFAEGFADGVAQFESRSRD